MKTGLHIRTKFCRECGSCYVDGIMYDYDLVGKPMSDLMSEFKLVLAFGFVIY